jgi:hypothetical protein
MRSGLVHEGRRRETSSAVSLAQGIGYIATGLWPILHMKSFEAVTGPKTDRWLVKTMGGLIAAVGVSLVVGHRRPSPGVRALGVASAASLAAADVVYGGTGRISRVYLADAIAEIALIAGWLASRRRAVIP